MRQESGSRTPKGLDIALVHWAFPPTVGGVESYLWNCSRLLARQGHRVTVFTGTPDARTPPGEGVEVLRHPGLDLSRATGDSAERQALRDWFRAELSEREIQLVHGHNLHHFSSAPAEALLELRDSLGLVLMHTYHSIWRETESVRLARPCSRFDVHFAVSEFLRQACADVLGVTCAKPMYLGIDTEPYLQVPELVDPPENDEAVILLPARLIPDKGAEMAVKAMAKVIKEDLPVRPYLVLMDAPDSIDFHGEKVGFRDSVQEWVKFLPEPDRVRFERAGVDGMVDLYSRARVVVCPSLFAEPMGLAALEAMCAARPVIATEVGGLAEGIGEHDVSGFLVAPGDVDGLADCIVRLLRSPGLARDVGLAARKRVREDFDLEHRRLPPLIGAYADALRVAPRRRWPRDLLTRAVDRWGAPSRRAAQSPSPRPSGSSRS